MAQLDPGASAEQALARVVRGEWGRLVEVEVELEGAGRHHPTP